MKLDVDNPEQQWLVKLQQTAAGEGITAQLKADETVMKHRHADQMAGMLARLIPREAELADQGLVMITKS